ncbi:MAG: adenylate kinase [Neisseriaceae bacterium]
MNILLLGPPGAGKGTQANYISQVLKIPHIATGDILRASIRARTPLGEKAEKAIAKGVLVEDAIIIGMIKDRLHDSDCKAGFLLDGFPRTLPQAQALLEENITITDVITLTVPDEVIVARISGRWIHAASGRTYHVSFNPPKVSGKDDLTQEPLVQREDDKETTVRQRLEIYHQQTEVLIDFYQNQYPTPRPRYIEIDGTQPVEQVREAIMQVLKS